MIAGLGVDLVDITRVDRLLRQYGDQFARRVLAVEERAAYAGSARPVWFLANRFAAKEALSKALGTGLRYPVTLHAWPERACLRACLHGPVLCGKAGISLIQLRMYWPNEQ